MGPTPLGDEGFMVRRWLTLFVIVTAPSGCDNVAWGGVDVRLEAPPPKAQQPVDEAQEEAASDVPLPELPSGPLLLAGTRDGSNATLAVVAEIRPDGLAPLPSEAEAPGFAAYLARQRLGPGTHFVLFSEGVRVGRLTVGQNGSDARFCQPRPTVTGVVEMVPSAANATRLLAVSADAVAERPFQPHRSWSHDYDQRVASLTLAQAAIAELGAPWPPSVLEARADIQAFDLPDAARAIAATFLYQDRLAVARPGDGAYSLFVLGTESDGDYVRSFTWYRRADQDGKGAPRYFDHLDWDGDGASEILLDVFGAEGRWFAALDRGAAQWTRSFQDPCGSGGAAR